MHALQCNRCGQFFNPTVIKGEFCHFENPDIRTAEQYNQNLSGRYLDAEEGRNAIIDLCPDCTKKFVEFMEGDVIV